MPVVLLGGIFATVPLFGVVMRYTIPPLFFVNYVGIVSRHRLFRATNSYVPRCSVHAIFVSANRSIFVPFLYLCRTLRNSLLSRPSDDREMTETKKCQFFDQKRTKITYLRKNTCICQKIVVSLHPIGCIAQRVRENMQSIQKDSIYAGLP